MRARLLVCGLTILFLSTQVAFADGSVLDLIPDDATGALGISSVDELRKKGDRFFTAADVKDWPRPSQLFDQIYDSLGLKKGLKRSGSGAIVLANPDLLGIQLLKDNGEINFDPRLMNLFVLAVPTSDPDAFADNFGIAKGKLKSDTMVEGGPGKVLGKFFYLRGNHVFYGNDAKVVESVARGKRVGGNLAAGTREGLDRADVLLYVNACRLTPLVKDLLRGMERGGLFKQARPEDQKTLAQLRDTLADMETTWIAVRVDEGLGVSWITTYPRKPSETARTFLASLQRGSARADLTDLAGLPNGQVLAAQAVRGDGAQLAPVMRAFYGLVLDNLEGKVLAAADRENFLGVAGEVWKKLRGSRFALYTNADRARHGLFSAVAILDVPDPAAFLGELRQLADFAALTDEPEAGGKSARPALQELADKLGSARYADREAAALRLRLAGEPALPFLEKAAASTDPEVRRRAKVIKDRIVGVAVQRRKELLSDAALRPAHFLFGFGKPETFEGQPIEVVHIKPSQKGVLDKLHALLGPDGDRIRLAVQGKQVVALVGSDRELLRGALQNLKEHKQGLGDAKVLAGARQHLNPARLMEFDLGLAASQAVWNATDVAQPGPLPSFLTSFGLTAAPDLLQFDVWIPPEEYKIAQRVFGGF
jgi:hypothetical protein